MFSSEVGSRSSRENLLVILFVLFSVTLPLARDNHHQEIQLRGSVSSIPRLTESLLMIDTSSSAIGGQTAFDVEAEAWVEVQATECKPGPHHKKTGKCGLDAQATWKNPITKQVTDELYCTCLNHLCCGGCAKCETNRDFCTDNGFNCVVESASNEQFPWNNVGLVVAPAPLDKQCAPFKIDCKKEISPNTKPNPPPKTPKDTEDILLTLKVE